MMADILVFQTVDNLKFVSLAYQDIKIKSEITECYFLQTLFIYLNT